MELIATYDLLHTPSHKLHQLEQYHKRFDLIFKPNTGTDYSMAISLLTKFHETLQDSTVTLHNIPPCLAPEFREHIQNGPDVLKYKPQACTTCRYTESCGGIYPSEEVQINPIPDIPQEMIIEITPRCNLNCFYCFNTFKRTGHELSTAMILTAIDQAHQLGVPYFRITGGEPLMRDDLFDILKYAQGKFKEIRLNTNGQLIDEEKAQELAQYVHNILIPLNAPDPESEKEVTGHDSFQQKKDAIHHLKQAGVPIVRSGTIALEKNIDNFQTLRDLTKELGLDAWEWYRPVSQEPLVSEDSLKKLVDILNRYKKKGEFYPIANAIPFCFYDPKKVSSIALGARFDDGHTRIVLSPKGYYKPSYFLDRNLGDDLPTAWKNWQPQTHPECTECIHEQKCKGGSRLFERDPLMPSLPKRTIHFRNRFHDELEQAPVEMKRYYEKRGTDILFDFKLLQLCRTHYTTLLDMGAGYGTESIIAGIIGYTVTAIERNRRRLEEIKRRKAEYEKEFGRLDITALHGSYEERCQKSEIIMFKRSFYFNNSIPGQEVFSTCRNSLSPDGLIIINGMDTLKGPNSNTLLKENGLSTISWQIGKPERRRIENNKNPIRTATFITLASPKAFSPQFLTEVEHCIKLYHPVFKRT
ncbi:MAG: radical SAM protein [Nanobdellota archaeon]